MERDIFGGLDRVDGKEAALLDRGYNSSASVYPVQNGKLAE